MSRRAFTPVVGTIILLAVVIVLGSTIAYTVSINQPESGLTAHLSGRADADTNRIVLEHVAGETLHVNRLHVRVTIEGQALAHQPPVPFFAARGFRAGPTGPFNSAADGEWSAGETASFRIAGTNSPRISPGSAVTVRVCTTAGCLPTVRMTAT